MSFRRGRAMELFCSESCELVIVSLPHFFLLGLTSTARCCDDQLNFFLFESFGRSATCVSSDFVTLD